MLEFLSDSFTRLVNSHRDIFSDSEILILDEVKECIEAIEDSLILAWVEKEKSWEKTIAALISQYIRESNNPLYSEYAKEKEEMKNKLELIRKITLESERPQTQLDFTCKVCKNETSSDLEFCHVCKTELWWMKENESHNPKA